MYDNGFYGSSGPSFYDTLMCKEAKKTFSRFALALFLYLIIGNVAAVIIEVSLMGILGIDRALQLISEAVPALIIGSLPMYIISLPILYVIVKPMPTKLREKTKLPISELLLIFLVMQGCGTIGNAVGNALNGFFSVLLNKEIDNSTIDIVLNSPPWLVFLIVVILGPIVEEFIFRKLLIDRVSRYGDVLAIVISAVAFGLFHGNFYQFFYSAMIGAIFAYVYVRSGNWVYPTVLHVLFNFFGSFIPILLTDSQTYILEALEIMNEGGTVDFGQYFVHIALFASYLIVQYAMAIAGIIILVTAIKRNLIFVKNNREACIPEGKTLACTVGNVGSILFLVFSLFTFLLSIIA